MAQITTVGRLLNELHRESPAVFGAAIHAAGVPVERADAARIGTLRLTLSEQLRLSEASAIVLPRLTRNAHRLRGQVLAARNYEAAAFVQRHRDSPAVRWEAAAMLRR